MNPRKTFIPLLFFLAAFASSCGMSKMDSRATTLERQEDSRPYAEISCSPTSNGNAIDVSIKISPGSELFRKTCLLDSPALQCERSSDGKSIIVSETHYIEVDDIKNCSSEITISTRKIPDNAGFLVDINVEHSIYLTLDMVSTNPSLFIATVAKIWSTTNLVDLPGAYSESKDLSDLQAEGFNYTPGTSKPRISQDGRYAAASGEIECTADAHPGVWDITKNEKVVLNNDPDGQKCRALFNPE